jgi:predicted TIM-barrel fold metal-dependent hydrolase
MEELILISDFYKKLTKNINAEYQEDNKMFYNCHIHTFRDIDVPINFLPCGLVRILATTTGFRVIGRILHNLNSDSDKDIFDRYLIFLKTGKLSSQAEIFKKCQDVYGEEFRFVILPMDMEFMGAGKVRRPYKDQIKELAELKTTYPDFIIPFLHVDPRREGIFDLLKECVENRGFRGIKLYPSIGYFPYDEALYPIYEYCLKNNLPVISHCGPYTPVRFKGSPNELHKLLSKSRTPVVTEGKSRKELCSYFAHPANYEYIFKDVGNVKICLAHFGSYFYWDEYIHDPDDKGNWFVIIKQMISKYPTLYTDISFTLNKPEYFPILKTLLSDPVILKKVLFGSDYYMVETKTEESWFEHNLRDFIGESDFNAIAVTNPAMFLT